MIVLFLKVYKKVLQVSSKSISETGLYEWRLLGIIVFLMQGEDNFCPSVNYTLFCHSAQNFKLHYALVTHWEALLILSFAHANELSCINGAN